MNSREVFPLFSTPLTVTNRFLPTKYIEPLVEYYKGNDDIWEDKGFKFQSMQTKSKKTLDEHPDVKWYIEKDFNMFIKDMLLLEDKYKFALGTSWGTKTTPEHASSWHQHSNYFYSGVYYFEESETPIEFQKPVAGYRYGFEKKDFNIFNNETFSVKPEANSMVYFPSWLEHRIAYHEGDTHRYSIAMNFTPVGTWGTMDSEISMEMSNG